MERNLQQIPLHNPGQIVLLTEERSMSYRVSRLHLFNLLRLVALLFAIGLYFLGDQSEQLLPFYNNNSTKLFLTIAIFYAFSLAAHAYLISDEDVAEWLFVSNAVLDMLFVIALILFFNVKEHMIFLALVAMCSTLLSSLTFSMRQSLFFGGVVALIWVIAASLFKIFPLVKWPLLEPISSWQRIANVGNAFIEHRNLLIEPTLFAFGITAVSVLIGYFAAQGRDNRISAELNRQYTAQLRKLNDSIIEDMQNGLLVVSGQGIIMTLNREARLIFGLSENAVVPYKIEDLSPEVSQRMWDWNVMVGENDLSVDINKRKYSVNFTPLKPHSDMSLTLVTLENIHQTLRRAQENRLTALGRLTTGISHEIKNPLNAIQNAAQLLEEVSGHNQRLRFLTDKIWNNTQRINSIINDISNLFQNKPCNKKLISLNSFLLSVVSEARLDDEMNKAIIRADIKASIGFAIFFDASYLRQILNNLMLNAIKHANRELVDITIRTSISSIGRFLYIDVLDNGVGVNAEDEEDIFEPFFSKRHSTGLGLYIVREMCVANQAQITYVRQVHGACFRLSMERYLSDNTNEQL